MTFSELETILFLLIFYEAAGLCALSNLCDSSELETILFLLIFYEAAGAVRAVEFIRQFWKQLR